MTCVMGDRWRIVVTGATFIGYSTEDVIPECIKASYPTKREAEFWMLTLAMLRQETIGHLSVERGHFVLVHRCLITGNDLRSTYF